MGAIATLAISAIPAALHSAPPTVAITVYALLLKPVVVLEVEWEPIVRLIADAQGMERAILMEHVRAIVVSFSIRLPKSVSSSVWDSQVPTAMLPICLTAVAVRRVLARMEHAYAGLVLVVQTVQLNLQYHI